MKLAASVAALHAALLTSPGHGFLPSPVSPWSTATARCGNLSGAVGGGSGSGLKSSYTDDEKERIERMAREIMAEEAMDPNNMAESAKAMKDMKPEDMDRIIKEMDGMDPAQRDQLKAMGMDPALMKKSLQMMRENPAMMESAQKMMESMTPQQMIEQSRLAQQQMKNMSPDDVEIAAEAINSLSPEQVEAAAQAMKQGGNIPQKENEEEAEEGNEAAVAAAVPLEGSAADPEVIDTMFRVAELMSQPPKGGVTFKAFSTLPPIVTLSGEREEDLSARELSECWAEGSLGATRVDRAGFERVWDEVRDYFEGDIMDEARKTANKRIPTAAATATATAASTPPPAVGANLTPEQMSAVNERVKNLSDDDVSAMLGDMQNMSPEQQARMKAMGVDPEMMKKASQMMEKNPMMRKAAQAMMSKMTPEQMMKASQQAQEQLAGMSKEDYEKAMEQMKKGK